MSEQGPTNAKLCPVLFAFKSAYLHNRVTVQWLRWDDLHLDHTQNKRKEKRRAQYLGEKAIRLFLPYIMELRGAKDEAVFPAGLLAPQWTTENRKKLGNMRAASANAVVRLAIGNACDVMSAFTLGLSDAAYKDTAANAAFVARADERCDKMAWDALKEAIQNV